MQPYEAVICRSRTAGQPFRPSVKRQVAQVVGQGGKSGPLGRSRAKQPIGDPVKHHLRAKRIPYPFVLLWKIMRKRPVGEEVRQMGSVAVADLKSKTNPGSRRPANRASLHECRTVDTIL